MTYVSTEPRRAALVWMVEAKGLQRGLQQEPGQAEVRQEGRRSPWVCVYELHASLVVLGSVLLDVMRARVLLLAAGLRLPVLFHDERRDFLHDRMVNLFLTLGSGRQSGAYSPPAPCFDLTTISSAISLDDRKRIKWKKDSNHEKMVQGKLERSTNYCKARLSSLSFPTSARSIRTSLANALLKSLMYLVLEKRLSFPLVDHNIKMTRRTWEAV